MCLASLAFSLMAFAVRAAVSTLPALEVVFFRSLLGTLMIGAVMIRQKVSFLGKPEERKLLLLRGLSGFLALTLYFYTISVLPLGTAVIINYTGIIFVAVLAILLLGERPGVLLISMILVSFVGVYLLVHPESGSSLLKNPGSLLPAVSRGAAVTLGIFSAIFAAIAVLMIRRIGERESPLTVIFYFTGISTMGSLFYLFLGFRWPNLLEWGVLLGVAAGSFFGQLWMTRAYAVGPASLVSPFSFLVPLLAFFFGLVFWQEKLTWTNLFGAFFILLSGTLISIFEARRGRPHLWKPSVTSV